MTLHATLTHVREDPRGYDEDIRALAQALLGEHELVVNARAHRIVEIEAYYFGEQHRDPFAHRDPRQLEPGRWYLHRTGGTLRGGSFKGIDLTFGRPGTYGGILLRSVRTDTGSLVSGPSLLVDHLVTVCALEHHAALDAHFAGLGALDPTSLVHLRPAPARGDPIVRTARVGLTLKRWTGGAPNASMPEYVGRPDRFLTDPRAIKKGRTQTIVALHEAGVAVDAIVARTGSPRRAIERVLAAYREGAEEPLESFARRELDALGLACLLGAWRASHPSP